MSENRGKIIFKTYDHFIALGIAWHLDSGFWNILGDFLLGWIYVSYKLAQYIWSVT